MDTKSKDTTDIAALLASWAAEGWKPSLILVERPDPSNAAQVETGGVFLQHGEELRTIAHALMALAKYLEAVQTHSEKLMAEAAAVGSPIAPGLQSKNGPQIVR